MSTGSFHTGSLRCVWLAAVAVVLWLASVGTAFADCTGPGAPSNTETRCLTAVPIPGGLTAFDISFVNPHRAEYYLADRTNKGVDIIDTSTDTFKKRIFSAAFPFAGIQADNNHSGPDGVVARGRCLYAGDGDSTLKVFDIDEGPNGQLLQRVDTGAVPKTRLDEMALSADGRFLLAVNNAADPPFATLSRSMMTVAPSALVSRSKQTPR